MGWWWRIRSKFKNHLLNNGIKYQVSCLNTFEQNGLAKHKNRNITKLGLTMMLHANVLKRFWIEAIGTNVWLIN